MYGREYLEDQEVKACTEIMLKAGRGAGYGWDVFQKALVRIGAESAASAELAERRRWMADAERAAMRQQIPSPMAQSSFAQTLQATHPSGGGLSRIFGL